MNIKLTERDRHTLRMCFISRILFIDKIKGWLPSEKAMAQADIIALAKRFGIEGLN